MDKLRKRLNVPIIVPCGDMIDGLAGKLSITPRLKNVGLALLFGLVQEPRRLYK